jgi:hypothetical protein
MGSIFPVTGFGSIVTFLGNMYSLKGDAGAPGADFDFCPLDLVVRVWGRLKLNPETILP